jgi:two-component system sensor histidine kinase and response regulator WspE
MEDGAPVLILDVDDLVRSIEKVSGAGKSVRCDVPGVRSPDTSHLTPDTRHPTPRTRKRILVVDDSLTVRELERKLLADRGFEVDVAVDGVDAWNAIRAGEYDLVVTDVDMPRMDGIELVRRIKSVRREGSGIRHPTPKVIIVSYKDRHEDRKRGLEAGVDFYLTKGSFDDETLLKHVIALIGEP